MYLGLKFQQWFLNVFAAVRSTDHFWQNSVVKIGSGSDHDLKKYIVGFTLYVGGLFYSAMTNILTNATAIPHSGVMFKQLAVSAFEW